MPADPTKPPHKGNEKDKRAVAAAMFAVLKAHRKNSLDIVTRNGRCIGTLTDHSRPNHAGEATYTHSRTVMQAELIRELYPNAINWRCSGGMITVTAKHAPPTKENAGEGR